MLKKIVVLLLVILSGCATPNGQRREVEIPKPSTVRLTSYIATAAVVGQKKMSLDDATKLKRKLGQIFDILSATIPPDFEKAKELINTSIKKKSMKNVARIVLVMIRANTIDLVNKKKIPLENVRDYIEAIKAGFNEAMEDYLKDQMP